MNKILSATFFIFAFISIVGSSVAGPVTSTKSVTNTEAWSAFAKGNNELELMGGAFWGVGTKGMEKRPDVGFALASLRYGWMLNDPSGDGIFRGNCEFLIGAFGGPIFEGPGSYHVGADLILRYNFVQPEATVVPFFQISAGGAYSDVARDDEVQRLLGFRLEFCAGFQHRHPVDALGAYRAHDCLRMAALFQWGINRSEPRLQWAGRHDRAELVLLNICSPEEPAWRSSLRLPV